MSDSTTEASEQGRSGCAVRRWLAGNATTLGACKAALLLLRLMVGVIFVTHGVQKAFGWLGGRGFSATVGMVESIGFPLPGLFAVLLTVAELGGGVALILGAGTRAAALLIAAVMVVAMSTVHARDGFFGTHLQQMVLAACAALMIAGGGAPALLPSRKRRQPPAAERPEQTDGS
jgi:putative oxidoreductase